MQFHDSHRFRPKEWRDSEESYLRNVIGHDSIAPQMFTDPLRFALSSGPALERFVWHRIGRPYYNIFPLVTDLVDKFPLDTDMRGLELPYSPLLIRFPVGREPYGIKSMMLGFRRSEKSKYETMSDGSRVEVFPLRGNFNPTNDGPARWFTTRTMISDEACNVAEEINGLFLTFTMVFTESAPIGEPGFGGTVLAVAGSPVSISDHLEMYLRELDTEKKSFQTKEIAQFVFRLAAFLSLLGQGNDLITPALLKKDIDDNVDPDELLKRWEHRKGSLGLGHDVGRAIDEQYEKAKREGSEPHWRRPHEAIQWYGKGRKQRKLIVRSGCFVTPHHLKDVPTGLLGPETQEEIDAPEVEQKPYFRPHIPKRMRFNVLRRDGFACRYCGLSPNNCEGVVLHADHVVSVNDGGATTEDNLITACDCCNLGKWKDSLSPEEIRQFSEQFVFDNKHPNRIKNKRRAKQHAPH